MRTSACGSAKMAGIPIMPRNLRELMVVTATDEDCRQWLVQQQLLAAHIQCPCGAACIHTTTFQPFCGRKCAISFMSDYHCIWYVCRPNSYLLKFIYLSSEQSPISSVHMCDVSHNELMKAVQQTAYWYCARSMQNGVYDSDGTIWLQEKTIGKIRYYTKISRYNTIRYSTSDHAVAVSTNKGSCDQIC